MTLPDEEELLHERKQIRREERLLRKNFKKENSPMNPLKSELKKFIPEYLMPGNVGHWLEVTWDFFHPLSFDFGANPVWTPTTAITQSFNVSNDAAFIIKNIYRKTYAYSAASELSPLQINMRDRQSGRQLTDTPVPLQNIGNRHKGTHLPTGYMLLPNSFLDVTLSSWVTANTNATVGSGKIELVFEGYRMRVENQEKLYSTIFKK
jgi:hypothetical protein